MPEQDFAARVERFLDVWGAAPIQRTTPRHVISKQSTMDPNDPYAELVDTDLRAILAELAEAHEELNGLEDQAVEKITERMWQQVKLRDLQIRAGTFTMDMEDARELASAYVAAARTMLGDAENYTETKLHFTAKIAEAPERYVLTVQRYLGLTPHEARQRAEEELDKQRQRADKAERELADLRAATAPADYRDGRCEDCNCCTYRACTEDGCPTDMIGHSICPCTCD